MMPTFFSGLKKLTGIGQFVIYYQLNENFVKILHILFMNHLTDESKFDS